MTLGPIDQVGCLRACSGVTEDRSSGPSRNGPPEAVSTSAATAAGSSPWRHWNRAECSESTGVICPPDSLATSQMRGPATTIASLVARATWRPAARAARVGASPAKPGMAATTLSASIVATSWLPSTPVTSWVPTGRWGRTAAAVSGWQQISGGRNRRACSSRVLAFRPPTSPTMRYPRQVATSSVWRPIEPVEPRTVIAFT